MQILPISGKLQILSISLIMCKNHEGHFYHEPEEVEHKAPDLTNDSSAYTQLVKKYDMGLDERLLLLLFLSPNIRPEILDVFFAINNRTDRNYTEFGGWQGKFHSGFLPTCQTAAFILGDGSLDRRFAISRHFDESHYLVKERILDIGPTSWPEPFFSRPLSAGPNVLRLLPRRLLLEFATFA